jgi:toluene monooxygenase system protein B
MAQFPLIFNMQYDYGVKLVLVDTEDTMDEVAQKSAYHSAGKLVKAVPDDAILRVRLQDEKDPLPRDLKVKDAGFVKMECIQVLVDHDNAE